MTTSTIEGVRAWSYQRQRLGPYRARTPLEALKAVVAVYATHPASPLSLAARSARFNVATYRRIDRQRRSVRIPAMRGTLFLVPRASASAVFAATRPPLSRIRRSLARHDLSPTEYERVATRILAAAPTPVSARYLTETTGLAGPALGTVLRCLRYEGRMLALAGGSLASAHHDYVATDTWLPGVLDAHGHDDPLGWLAGQYFHAYGPARAADFAWWAGVSRSAAARAVGQHDTIDLGDGLLLPRRDEAAFGRTRPLRGTVDLLPRWDAYTMGHAPDGRARFVDPEAQPAVYTPAGPGLPGDGNPVVLVDGQVAGLWSFTVKDGPTIHPFEPFGPKLRRAVVAAVENVARLLSPGNETADHAARP